METCQHFLGFVRFEMQKPNRLWGRFLDLWSRIAV